MEGTLRQRRASSDRGSPGSSHGSTSPRGTGNPTGRLSLDDWGQRVLSGQLEDRYEGVGDLERGRSQSLPTHVGAADVREPAAAPRSTWTRAKDGGRALGRWGRRQLPFVPLYAATVSTVALIIATVALRYALKNFNILDQSRAANLVRALTGQVGEAHQKILDTLAAFQADLNQTLNDFKDDRNGRT